LATIWRVSLIRVVSLIVTPQRDEVRTGAVGANERLAHDQLMA
jgi:hypothetical protein